MSKLVKVKDNAPSIKDKMKKDPTKVSSNGVGGGAVVTAGGTIGLYIGGPVGALVGAAVGGVIALAMAEDADDK